MIVVLLNVYIAILALFVWLRFIPFNLFWKISPVLVLLVPSRRPVHPDGMGRTLGAGGGDPQLGADHPLGRRRGRRRAGAANVPVKEGEVLFRIDPTTYQAQVQAIEAQLKFAELRLGPVLRAATPRHRPRLRRAGAASPRSTNSRPSSKARKWNLDRTTVRAPADGYVTNLALRKGARVTGAVPGDGLHRHVGGDLRRRRSRRSTRATSRSASRSRSRSRPSRARSFPGRWRRCCRPSRPDRRSPAVSPSCRPRCRPRRSSSGSSSTTRKWRRRLPAGSTGRGRDLHRPRQGEPRHPAGAAASDGDPELRQSVLIRVRDAAGPYEEKAQCF